MDLLVVHAVLERRAPFVDTKPSPRLANGRGARHHLSRRPTVRPRPAGRLVPGVRQRGLETRGACLPGQPLAVAARHTHPSASSRAERTRRSALARVQQAPAPPSAGNQGSDPIGRGRPTTDGAAGLATGEYGVSWTARAASPAFVLARAFADGADVAPCVRKQKLRGLARTAARVLLVRESGSSANSGAVLVLAVATSIRAVPHGRIQSCSARRPLRSAGRQRTRRPALVRS